VIRVLGLDPGLRHTGWGIVEADGSSLRFRACGVVRVAAEGSLALRLQRLHDSLAATIRDFRPVEAAVEETVVNRNAGSSLKLGHARGVVLLTAARAGLTVHEYGAKTVKRAVTGTGAADKRQVAAMVRMLLPGCGTPVADAADALAVAICHVHHRAGRLLLAKAAGR